MVTANNPILSGFYPDPSICRAGDDYYIVNSSFVYAPGVPIFHSRDLAHWEQIGNILNRKEQLPVEGSEISRGIFAPTIRYHEGLFYMITTNVSYGGNFIVTAKKPEGPWSDPYYLGEEAAGIDPSLFFDEDGKCYYCGTRPNPEGVRYNGDWEIWVQELDLNTMKLTGESMTIWKGAVKDCIWPEGPHIYKIGEYYYLMHAEGGTGPEHSISVARSRKLFQWFEGCPRNPIFTHRNLGMDYPVIYAGHGDLVDDGHGNWYTIKGRYYKMKRKKIVSMLLASAMAATLLAGCGAGGKSSSKGDSDGEIKEFTAFFAVPGSEINDDNEVQQIIAEKTGAKVKETWLTGQTDVEAIGTMIAGGEYPDFIEGGNGQMQLYDADALVALDDYLDDYPNIKNLFSDLEWEKLRQDDGHIYWIPQFSCIKNEEKVCTHNDEAFWIQARVLKWAGYPEIKTMDDYFNLIESYNEANPTMEDGTENIPYTILCDDWRYFCLENAPQFLDGYPNDGSCMVDPDTLTVLDYNTSDTAVAYFRKLNEEYQKGIVDPESFTQSYDEYISKLSTGRVLGMIDQWWDFSNANDAIKQAGLDEQGCDYIPVPVTIDGRDNQWHNSGGAFNESSGLAITTSCEDVEGALQFVNDLLDQDIHNLRFWGVEGTDYEVDENGEFYRTEEERTKQSDTAYKASHTCPYSYFPQYTGTSDDGINANKPDGQASEFFDGLNQDVKETFEAYGVETYVEMLGTNEAPGDWYPMWSFSNNFTTDTPGGVAWNKIADVKHEQLPQVVMAKDFDAAWDTYMDAYNACHPEDFISELQTELDTRMEQAAKFK